MAGWKKVFLLQNNKNGIRGTLYNNVSQKPMFPVEHRFF